MTVTRKKNSDYIKDVIFFSRDLFGQKPLYYFKNNNEVIFSSEIKPIIKLLSPKKIEFEQKEINKYLNYNFYGDANLTFFRKGSPKILQKFCSFQTN